MSILFPEGLVKIISNYFTKSIFTLFDENELITHFYVDDKEKIKKFIEKYVDKEYYNYIFHDIEYYNYDVPLNGNQLSETSMEVIMCENYDEYGIPIGRASRCFYLKEYIIE
jgi:hypothetical protein